MTDRLLLALPMPVLLLLLALALLAPVPAAEAETANMTAEFGATAYHLKTTQNHRRDDASRTGAATEYGTGEPLYMSQRSRYSYYCTSNILYLSLIHISEPTRPY